MDKTISIIACRVGEDPIVEELPKNLKSMQEFVGGFVECISLSYNVDLWCNDEFLFNGSVPNRLVRRLCGDWYPIHGDFFLASHDNNGETIGLTLSQQTEWLKELQNSPIFLEASISINMKNKYEN